MTKKKLLVLVFLVSGMNHLVRAQDIDEAKQLIDNERYSSAEALLEKSLGDSEPQPEVNYLLVKSYLEQDKSDEAGNYVNRHLQSALNTNADPLNRISRARYLLNAGNKQAATEIFASVLNNSKNQKNPSLLLAMAEVAIEEENGDARASLRWLDMAEKRDRNNPDIDIARGLAYRKLKDATNAFLAYQEAIRKDPANVRAYYLMGKIFTAQKNPDIYMQHFTKAFEIDSAYAPVLEELYNHYYYRDVKMAKKYLEKYIANADHSVQNDYYMTDMLYLNGDYREAIQSANEIITKEKAKAQPRLYKLIAYSYAKSGDSVRALQYINSYFDKEDNANVIAADYQLIAQLSETATGREKAAIAYYTIAAETDTIQANKAEYASAIARLYEKIDDPAMQALWLGNLYEWKDKTNNVDLFNWGLACYRAKNYQKTDSVFSIYTTQYPDDIYGYYWRAQANAAIDTSMTNALAIPFYSKVIEIGELNTEKNKKMLLKAYGYLGGYEANISKDYEKSLGWFEKYLAIVKENTDIKGYVEMLRKWIARKK